MKNTDPWKKMDEIINYSKPPEGPEWFSPLQFSTKYGMHYNAACNKLRSMFIAGKLKQWKGHIPGEQGRQTRYAPA